jgi:hypothetical protein
MNLLVWVASLSILVTLLLQGVNFHRATVCRQEAWLKSAELKTRSLLSKPKSHERDWHLACRLHVLRKQDRVSWQRLPKTEANEFHLPLKGSL